jgi:hypothetical protein
LYKCIWNYGSNVRSMHVIIIPSSGGKLVVLVSSVTRNAAIYLSVLHWYRG